MGLGSLLPGAPVLKTEGQEAQDGASARQSSVLGAPQSHHVAAELAVPPLSPDCPVPPSRNLSNNRIKEVREGAFDGAASVQELMLTGNQLEAVHGRVFRGLSGLKTL